MILNNLMARLQSWNVQYTFIAIALVTDQVSKSRALSVVLYGSQLRWSHLLAKVMTTLPHGAVSTGFHLLRQD